MIIALWRYIVRWLDPPPRVVYNARDYKRAIKKEVMRRDGLTGKQFQALIRKLRREGVL